MLLSILGIIPSIKTSAKNASKKGADSDVVKIEGDGFDSPEEAVNAYIKALNDGDIDGMLATYAIESYVDNFDTKAQIEKIACFIPAYSFNYTYEFSDGSVFDRNIRIKERQAYIMRNYYSMISQQTVHHDMKIIGPLEGDALDEFMNEMEKTDFLNAWKNMKFVRFISPDEICDTYNSETVQDNIKQQAKLYRCDSIIDVCALVEIDGEEHYQFAQCGMYNGKWYILSLEGTLFSLTGAPADSWGLVAY